MKRGELYLVKKPSGRDPKKQRVFVVVSRQVLKWEKRHMGQALEVEITEQKTLVLRKELLGSFEPHDRFAVEYRDNGIFLRPKYSGLVVSKWLNESPEERITVFREHVRRFATEVGLSDQAVSRDTMYD